MPWPEASSMQSGVLRTMSFYERLGRAAQRGGGMHTKTENKYLNLSTAAAQEWRNP